MTSPTHIAFGNILMFVLAKPLGLPINVATAAYCSFGAMIPDIDTPTSGLGRLIFPLARWIEGRWGHRTLTHSLLGWILFGILFLPLFFFSKTGYIALMIGIISHDIIDMLNTTGVAFLYPNGRRCVFPYISAYPTRYRIQTSSGAEFVLLGVLVALLVVFYPVGQFGFRRVLHVILGNPKGAVYDYREVAASYTVKAQVSAIDRITAKHFSGVYPVLGSLGMSTLVIKKDGKLYSLGLRDDTNFIPRKVKCMKDKKVTVITQEVDMASRPLGDIRYFLDSGKEQYLYGALQLTDNNISLPYDFTAFNPVYIYNRYLMLNIASWSDILPVSDAYISTGQVTIKTFLKEGETLTSNDAFEVEKRKAGGGIYAFSFKVDDPDQVLVQKNEKVQKGQVIAKTTSDISDIDRELSATKKERNDVLALKELYLVGISSSLRVKEEALLNIKKQIEVYERYQKDGLLTDTEQYKKYLVKQKELEESIGTCKRDYKIKEKEFSVKLLSLEQKILDLEKKRGGKEAEAIIVSKVSGVVANITFGVASSKIPVTIKIITDADYRMDISEGLENSPMSRGDNENEE